MNRRKPDRKQPSPNRRKLLRQELARSVSFQSSGSSSPSSIDAFRPEADDDCICGSGIKFQDCCSSKLHEGPSAGEHKLIDQGQFDEALIACRLHLSWYVLAHQAHTVPLLNAGDPQGADLLSVDINALDEILGLLHFLYRKTNQVDQFGPVLKKLQSAIHDSRWANKIALREANWWSFDRNDNSNAAQSISRVDVLYCSDAEVLAKYFSLNSKGMTFNERLEFIKRIIDCASDQELLLQYRGALAISYLLVSDRETASQLFRSAIESYRSSSAEDKSMFGDHLLAHSLFLLGALEADRELMKEAGKCFQTFVDTENEIPLTDYAKSDYRMMVGRCQALMEEPETAIGAYDESLRICVLPLTQIYKSEALINIGQPDSARELLTNVDKASAPVENVHDYAIAWTLLAATTQKQADIETAKSELKSLETLEPYFAQQRDHWLIQLLETVPNAESGTLANIIRSINRYITLNPNIFGFGVNLNSLLTDLEHKLDGRKVH